MKYLRKGIAILLTLLVFTAWAALFVGAAQTDLSDPATVLSGNQGETGNDPAGSNNETGNDPAGSNNETGADPSDVNTETGTEPEGQQEQPLPKATVTVKANDVVVTVRRKLQLTAETTGFASQPEITWKSEDESVAVVDRNGKVTGIKAGRVAIIATATLGEQTASGRMVVNVQRMRTLWRTLMRDTPVLSYQYSFTDDYYYIRDVDCWQRSFGFGRFYDLVAPYMLLEYDYVRVFFTYQNRDYMIQLWKGQYGLIFYGCEQGIYSKEHSDEPDGIFTFYQAMDPSEWPQMSLTLYHDHQRNGNYVREFTREPATHWWCSGFKFGHLKKEEPANELRQEGKITFKDPEMARLFAEGLAVCGFDEAKDADNIGLDAFYREGKTVSFRWQDINRAETTMPVKIVGGAAFAAGGLAFIIGLLLLLMLVFGGMGLVMLIVIL